MSLSEEIRELGYLALADEAAALEARVEELTDALRCCDWLAQAWKSAPDNIAEALSDIMRTAKRMRDEKYAVRIAELQATLVEKRR